MKSTMTLTILALALVGECHSAAVFQCTDKHGNQVFSDHPCAPDAKKTEVREQPRTGAQVFGGDTAAVLDREVDKSALARDQQALTTGKQNCPNDLDLKAKAIREQIALCMDDSHLKTILGKYARDFTRVNQARSEVGGELRRYGVRPQGFPLYVEMENGRVVGWFDHEFTH